ncbi:hypothetical protein G6F56_008092 [Rhizopus delemar]|nr:hypothetical protein G6F56_008092 [Rhizopus delemar]
MTAVTESSETHLLVYLTYVCYKCKSPSKVFKTPSNLRRHLMSPAHCEALPPRPVRGVYASATGKTNVVVVDDAVKEAVEYYGCTSCWLIHPDLNWMSNHIADSHEPINKNDIAISTTKDIFHFRPASVKPASKRVKITDEIVSALSPILTIIKDDLILDQTNLLSLNLYPTAYNLLVNALKVHLPDLPRFLWTFEHKNNIDRDDAIFVKTIQCVLTDFYSKSQRNPHYQPKYERTFWIDRVIPIFQALGDHSQLLGFQWCEIPTEEHMEFTLNPCTWKRNAANKYHDGLGYDDDNRNRLIMEGSSRYNDKESIEHSKDDTIKIIHTSIELLDSMIKRHILASFANLCRIKSFSVQCICTTITLSTTSLDPENPGSYIHTEVRFADIPTKYNNRASWASVFELLAYLFFSLREQEMILDTVNNESNGLIQVVDTDRGSNILQIKKQ